MAKTGEMEIKEQSPAGGMAVDGFKKHWLVIIALAVVIIVGSFWGHWQKASAPGKPAGVTAVGQPAAGDAGRPVVYISGAVNKPGVYVLEADSRVQDVVTAAGGLAPGADARRVNLAQAVKDGQQIYVPAIASPANPAAAAKVSINSADKAQLEKLPGIGPVLAQRIIDYRLANGPFREIGDIKRVSGIGESKFNQIKDRITLEKIVVDKLGVELRN